MTKREELQRWIKSHEGYREKPYINASGKLSIGFGRNLQENGITNYEAELLFQNDFCNAEDDLYDHDWFVDSPENVKDALINMCFNLGIQKLLTFKKMIEAIKDKDYLKAALEVLDSKWAKDENQRAKDIALMIRGYDAE